MVYPHLVDEALLQSAMVLALVCHRVPLRFTPCFYEMLRWSKCAPAMTPEWKYLEAQQRGSANVYFFEPVRKQRHAIPPKQVFLVNLSLLKDFDKYHKRI